MDFSETKPHSKIVRFVQHVREKVLHCFQKIKSEVIDLRIQLSRRGKKREKKVAGEKIVGGVVGGLGREKGRHLLIGNASSLRGQRYRLSGV